MLLGTALRAPTGDDPLVREPGRYAIQGHTRVSVNCDMSGTGATEHRMNAIIVPVLVDPYAIDRLRGFFQSRQYRVQADYEVFLAAIHGESCCAAALPPAS